MTKQIWFILPNWDISSGFDPCLRCKTNCLESRRSKICNITHPETSVYPKDAQVLLTNHFIQSRNNRYHGAFYYPGKTGCHLQDACILKDSSQRYLQHVSRIQSRKAVRFYVFCLPQLIVRFLFTERNCLLSSEGQCYTKCWWGCFHFEASFSFQSCSQQQAMGNKWQLFHRYFLTGAFLIGTLFLNRERVE